MNNEILTIIVTILLGAAIGFGGVMLYVHLRVRRFIKHIDEIVGGALEEAKSRMVPLLVEKENDTFYCYAEEDKRFICQGKTADEIKEALKKALPDKVGYIGDSTSQEILDELKASLTEVEIVTE